MTGPPPTPRTKTMTLVTHTLVTQTGPYSAAVDASDLGLRPGQFVGTLPTTMGNKQPFVFVRYHADADGDYLSSTYRQTAGCLELVVWND